MKRINSPEAAKRFIADVVNADQKRAAKRAKVNGMIGGNPPFDPAVLRKTGQSHRCNVNFLEGKGIIESRNTSFFQLFLDGQCLIECTLKNRYQGHAKIWQGIVQEEIKDLIADHWPDFEYEMMMLGQSMNTHGDAFPLWEAFDEWRWKTFLTGEVLFPENTKASVGHIKACVIMGEFDIADLLKKVDNPVIGDIGWNVEQIKKSIMRSHKKLSKSDATWDQVQQQFSNGTLAIDNGIVSPIKVSHLLTKEDSGKISHYIVEQGAESEGFVFKKEEAYESMVQVFIPFIANLGNGYFHGIKGIGHRVYPSVVINNRLLNRAVDGAMDSQSMILSFAEGKQRTESMMRLGNAIMLPTGAKLEQHSNFHNIEAATSMYGLLTQVNQSGQGIRRPGIAAMIGNDAAQKTARADTRQVIEEVELGTTEIKLYYKQLDLLYKETCRRIWSGTGSELSAFKNNCIERGVPEQLMKDFTLWRFRAPRLLGAGSKAMRHMSTQENLAIAAHVPESGKKEIIRDYIEARGGVDAVNRYYPADEDATTPTRSHQMAQIENTLLRQGNGMIVSVDDWHVPHLMSHFPYLDEMVTQAIQSGDQNLVSGAMRSSQLFLDHVGNHMAYLKGNDLYAAQFGQFNAMLKQVIPKIRNIQSAYNAIVEQQKAAQRAEQEKLQQLIERGDQAEMAKHMAEIQADVAIRQYKEDHNHQARLSKLVHSMQLAEMETQAFIDRENRKADAGGNH